LPITIPISLLLAQSHLTGDLSVKLIQLVIWDEPETMLLPDADIILEVPIPPRPCLFKVVQLVEHKPVMLLMGWRLGMGAPQGEGESIDTAMHDNVATSHYSAPSVVAKMKREL
jgi:hypothetical protein